MRRSSFLNSALRYDRPLTWRLLVLQCRLSRGSNPGYFVRDVSGIQGVQVRHVCQGHTRLMQNISFMLESLTRMHMSVCDWFVMILEPLPMWLSRFHVGQVISRRSGPIATFQRVRWGRIRDRCLVRRASSDSGSGNNGSDKVEDQVKSGQGVNVEVMTPLRIHRILL